MTWQPRTGDRVTSPLLVGEWVVDVVLSGMGAPQVRVTNPLKPDSIDRASAVVPLSTLTRVPTLPPEPPVGSVVYVEGEVWTHSYSTEWHKHTPQTGAAWSDIADRATPAVPLADVVQALVEWENGDDPSADPYDRPAQRIERLFGWPLPACGDPDCQHAPDGGNHPEVGR